MSTPRGGDELGRTLRRLRTESGLTLADVSERSGLSTATVSRLERGKYVPTSEQAEALSRAVDAPASVRRRLVSLAADLKERTSHRQVLLRAGAATAQRQFGDIEKASGHVQSFSPVVIVGLLQTPEYARAVFSSALPAEDVEPAVRARLDRQHILRGDGPALTQIMTEGALLWHVRSPELMAAQCEHIADLTTATGRVRIGIIPASTPSEVFPATGFDLYDERAVIVGTITGTAYLTNASDVGEYVTLFKRLVELAVFGTEAREVVEGVARRYRLQLGERPAER